MFIRNTYVHDKIIIIIRFNHINRSIDCQINILTTATSYNTERSSDQSDSSVSSSNGSTTITMPNTHCNALKTRSHIQSNRRESYPLHHRPQSQMLPTSLLYTITYWRYKQFGFFIIWYLYACLFILKIQNIYLFDFVFSFSDLKIC